MHVKKLIHLWVIRLTVRRAIKTVNNIRLITLYYLQIEFHLPPLGESETKDDKELVDLINSFHDWKAYSDELLKRFCEYRYFGWLDNDTENDSLRKLSFRHSHWLATSDQERRTIENIFRTVYQTDLNPLRDGEIRKCYSQIIKKKKAMHRVWNESRGRKIDLKILNIPLIVPLLSIGLICAGYLHTSIVYKHFGIDPTLYFSVGDYLASSLEQIQHTLYAILGMIGGFVVGFRRNSIRTAYEINTTARKDRFEDITWVALSWVYLLFSYFNWEMVASIPGVHIFLMVCLLVILQTPIHRFTSHHFNNSLPVSLIFITLLLFFGSMYLGAKTRISYIESENVENTFRIDTTQKRYTHSNSKIIGANTNFMFFLIRKDLVEIVPLSNIKRTLFINKTKPTNTRK